MMKTQICKSIIRVLVLGIGFVHATDNTYTQTFWDYKALQSIQSTISGFQENMDEDELIFMVGLVTKYLNQMSDDSQAQYVLVQSQQMLLDSLDEITQMKREIQDSEILNDTQDKKEVGQDSREEDIDNESQVSSIVSDTNVIDSSTVSSIDSSSIIIQQESEVLEDEQVVDTQEEIAGGSFLSLDKPLDEAIQKTGIEEEPVTPFADQILSLEELYNTFEHTISGALSPLCTLYFDQIDAIAKRNDFPTALIIAMRYREHSCILSNPENGWGNFQITSHYYEPGEIVWDEFATQVQNFINFSRAKWKYYDSIQRFGPEPVYITHDEADINSIRKHAILYNGVYPDVTLESSWYSNENFTQHRGGRDGIVATFLKVVERELENGKR